MPIVAPGVVRYVIEGEVGGQDCFNILDYNISDEGLTTSRDDAIEQAAGDLLNQWSDHILPILTPAYVAQRVSWIDLDTADGSTGSRSSTDGSSWPEAGADPGTSMPGNVCMRVRKNINGARGRRSGVLRLGGIAESWTSSAAPNVFQQNVIEAVNAAFESLKDGMNGAGDFTGNLVVTHTREGVYVADSNITTFQALPTVGSMRRRLPGYGN